MDMKPTINLNDISSAYALFSNEEEIRICHANEEFYKLIGYHREELELKNGARLSAILPLHDFLQIKSFLHEDKKDCILQISLNGKSQNNIWVNAYLQKVISGSSDFFYILFSNMQDLKNSEFRLKKLQDIFQNILNYEKMGVLIYKPDTGKILYCYNESFIMQKDCTNKKVPDVFFTLDKIHPDDVALIKSNTAHIQQSIEDTNVAIEIRMLNMKNEYVWIRLILAKHTFSKDSLVLCILTNIHAEKEYSTQFMEQSMFYQSLLTANDAYGQVDVTNDSFGKMGGLWNIYNELVGKMTYTELFHSFIEKIVHVEDRSHYIEVMERENLKESFENGITHLNCDFRRIVNQNKMEWMTINISLFKNPLSNHLMAQMCIKRMDDGKRQNLHTMGKELDALTRLFNRKTLSAHVSEYIRNLGKNELCAFLIFNINHIKEINNRHGYIGGDKILCAFSDILSNVFRKHDILGRFENDHFIAFLEDINRKELEKRLESLFQKIDSYEEIPFKISVGVFFTKQGDTFRSSYKQAAIALCTIKDKENNRYAIFNDYISEMEHNANIQEKVKDFTLQLHLDEQISTVNNYEFDSLVGEQGDIAYLVNPNNYELLLGNQALYERLGFSEEECKGRKCYEILHKRTSPCPYCQKGNWTEDKFYMYRNYNEVLEQEFLIKNKLVTWKGNTELLALAIDLSNDKSVVDSLEDEISEESYILNGVCNMQKGSKLDAVMFSALESIGTFFRATAVRFWEYSEEKEGLQNHWNYFSEAAEEEMKIIDDFDRKLIYVWLIDHKCDESIIINSKESMMTQSFELYDFMKRKSIDNQRWLRLYDDKNHELGVIEIVNVKAHFQNITFMKFFSTFIANEWKRCTLMQNILHAVHYDSLTGLYNRNSYDEFLRDYDPDAVDSIATIIIDINGLNDINTMQGTEKGDHALIKLANTMEKVFMGANNYRIGGDEFQCLWVNINIDQLEMKIQELRNMIITEKEFSIAIGYAWDSVEKKIKPLLESALQGMQVDKKNQKNDIKEVKDISHYQLQNELISSIERGQYLVYLQPKVDANNGNVIGAEALIRYKDPKKGLIPPSEYIPKLEKNGLIRYIDLFVYEEVCKLVDKWLRQGKPCPIISLNFSRLTMMEQNLIEIMDTIIQKYAIPKRYIEIEITESFGEVGKTLLYQSAKNIHEAGYSVSLDDFGTNFTNLSILSDIHVDVLKIDKSLIHSITHHSKNITVLKHIIDMCHDLHIKIIAEGVENMEQRNLLISLGCPYIQGYLFSRPVDTITFEHAFLPRVKRK